MTKGQAFELSAEEKQRYTRQMIIPNWGEETQRRLKASTVFIAVVYWIFTYSMSRFSQWLEVKMSPERAPARGVPRPEAGGGASI